MNEVMLEWIQYCKLLLIATYAMLYGFGGVSGKWKRRFVAPFILIAGIVGLSVWSGTFSPWFLLYYPLLSMSLHLGYGADEFWHKIKRRATCGLAFGFAAFPIALGMYLQQGVMKSWYLLGYHMALCIATCVILGVWNITESARSEETTIAAVTVILPLMMF